MRKIIFVAVMLAVCLGLFASVQAQEEEPIFTVVEIADNLFTVNLESGQDYWEGNRNSHLLEALVYTNEVIKPDFVIFGGDNISGAGAGNPPLDKELALTHLFEEIVDQKLDMPFLLVYGNHDGTSYPKVYGDGNFSQNYMGVKFLLLGIEYTPDFGGAGNFTRWDWLDAELESAEGMPVIAFLHNPAYFPTFNNAMKLKSRLDKEDNFVGIIAGHNHKEHLISSAGRFHLNLPQVVRGPGYPFVRVDFFEDRFVVRAVEKPDDSDGDYVQDRVIIEVPFPEKILPLNQELTDPVFQPRLEQPAD